MRKNAANQTLVELFPYLKQFAILTRPFVISLGESWYKLLVPHNITKFLKDEKQPKSCACHSTCFILLLPIPQLKAFIKFTPDFTIMG